MASVLYRQHRVRRHADRHPDIGTEAEDSYQHLIDHARHCRRCWETRDELWRTERLCRSGQLLAESYAALEVVAARRPA